MNDDAVAQPNSKAKRCREVKLQVASSVTQRHKTWKKSVENCGFDSEELVAQIHPNEITDEMPIAVEGEVRGSKHKGRSKKGTDASRKWNDEEEVCIAMALLESCPLGGKVNTAAYYQRAKHELGSEVSNERLYWKMRRMKKRFRDIWNKLKEQNIEEDNFTFRTPHEPALFFIWKQIWGQNNDFLQTECRKLYLGDIVAENPHSNEVEIRSTDFEEIDHGNPNSKEVEAGNPAPMEVVVRNPQRRVIDTEKGSPRRLGNERSNSSPRRLGNERSNSRIVEAGNSDFRINETEKISSDEFVNPNSKKIDDINPKEGNAETGTTACGDRRKVQLRYKQQEEDEEKYGAAESEISQGPQCKETETEYVSKRGRHRSLQCESRDWDSKMQRIIRNTESRLEEVMESSASRAIHAVNFQTLGGFEVELGMGTCGFSSVTRRTNELIDFSEQFYGVDAAEAQELQKKWNEINIQKTEIFCAHVELLNDQCKLFLKTVEQREPQECSYREILLEKQKQNGLRKCKNTSLENSLQSFIEKTQSKLEAASYINAAFTGSFRPSGGFGSVEMGSCVVFNLSRRLQELMDDVNSVEEFPCGDAIESLELQQKWHKIKIQKLKIFSENLELLKDECKLLLKSVDISNGCHRP